MSLSLGGMRLGALALSAALCAACGAATRVYEPAVAAGAAGTRGENVVLLHGLVRTAHSMNDLAMGLSKAGYRAHIWGYDSARKHIAEHGKWLAMRLRALEDDASVTRIHLVTHSLGGIVARDALLRRVPGKLGRVVMLGPPNQGSAAARRWAPIAGTFLLPLEELSDDEQSYVRRLGVPPGVEIGVIAARSDGRAPIETTHLVGETDHRVVPGVHTFLMYRQDVLEEVISFLGSGRFTPKGTDTR